jgi:hypothetical protein
MVIVTVSPAAYILQYMEEISSVNLPEHGKYAPGVSLTSGFRAMFKANPLGDIDARF